MRKRFLLCFQLLFYLSACKVSKKSSDQPVHESQTELLREYFKKKKLNREELMILAKKKGIPFRKEENGTIYELQGFDKKGRPIYYITSTN